MGFFFKKKVILKHFEFANNALQFFIGKDSDTSQIALETSQPHMPNCHKAENMSRKIATKGFLPFSEGWGRYIKNL